VPVSSISRIDAIVLRRHFLDEPHQHGENVGQGRAGRQHLQCPLFARLHEPRDLPRIVGDVATRADQRDGTALAIDEHLADRVELAHRTIRADDAFGMGERTAPLNGGGHQALHALTIVRVNTCEEALQRDLTRSRLEPVDAVQLVRPGHHAGCEVPFPAADVRDLLRRVELTLEPQCNFGLHQALPDVRQIRHPPASSARSY
jgi:hypothetical protein